MNKSLNYLAAGIAAAYLAIAPSLAEATSGYENRFKNYTPQIKADSPIFRPIVIRADIGQTPLEFILNVPGIKKLESPIPIKPYHPSFLH